MFHWNQCRTYNADQGYVTCIYFTAFTSLPRTGTRHNASTLRSAQALIDACIFVGTTTTASMPFLRRVRHRTLAVAAAQIEIPETPLSERSQRVDEVIRGPPPGHPSSNSSTGPPTDNDTATSSHGHSFVGATFSKRMGIFSLLRYKANPFLTDSHGMPSVSYRHERCCHLCAM